MDFKKLLQSWPVYRQLAGEDSLGRGKAAQSKRSVALTPRTAEADSVAHSVCPFCAVGCAQKVYVKDEQGRPDRGRTRTARYREADCVPRVPRASSWSPGRSG